MGYRQGEVGVRKTVALEHIHTVLHIGESPGQGRLGVHRTFTWLFADARARVVQFSASSHLHDKVDEDKLQVGRSDGQEVSQFRLGLAVVDVDCEFRVSAIQGFSWCLELRAVRVLSRKDGEVRWRVRATAPCMRSVGTGDSEGRLTDMEKTICTNKDK